MGVEGVASAAVIRKLELWPLVDSSSCCFPWFIYLFIYFGRGANGLAPSCPPLLQYRWVSRLWPFCSIRKNPPGRWGQGEAASTLGSIGGAPLSQNGLGQTPVIEAPETFTRFFQDLACSTKILVQFITASKGAFPLSSSLYPDLHQG